MPESLLALSLLDALATTLQLDAGPGLLTGRLLRLLWRPILVAERRLGASRCSPWPAPPSWS